MRLVRCRDGRMLAAIFLAAVLVRGATAFFLHQPGFTDSYYYYHVALNLYAGKGFVEDLIWNYLEAPSSVSHPSNSYWGPLASLLLVPSFWAFGPSFRAAQVPMVLVSALLPVIAYAVACDLLGSRRQALVAAALTIFSGVYLVYWTIPEGSVPFAAVGALALYAVGRAPGSFRWSVVVGLSIGIGQLARSDGAILMPVLLAFWCWRLWRQREGGMRYPLVALSTYALILAPWLYRNWLALGTPLPGGGLKTAFLRYYDEVFTYGGTLTFGSYVSEGWMTILTDKSAAALSNLHVLAEAVTYYLAPLVVVGLWALRSKVRAAPYFWYGLTLYATMTLIFTLPGKQGALLHSVSALLPFLMTAAAYGLHLAGEALVRLRPNLHLGTTRRVLATALVTAQMVLAVGLGAIAASGWESRYSYALYPRAIEWLSPKLGPAEPVMILDPPAYAFFSGRPAVAVPNNPPEVLLQVAQRYGVRFVLLEPAHMAPLGDVYYGKKSDAGLALRHVLTNDRGQELKIYELAAGQS